MSSKLLIIVIGVGIVLAISATIFSMSMMNPQPERLTNDKESPIIPYSNFAVVGDIGVLKESLNTVRNIGLHDPEVILLAGDLSYTSPIDWFVNTDFFLTGNQVLLAIGNHEVGSGWTAQDWLSHYGFPEEFYAAVYANVAFISLSTETSYSIESEQFKFLETRLKSFSKNPDIDWIIVFFHRPMYTDTTRGEIDFRNTLQPIFDKYGVDLVLQGHSHVYERTFPLKFNGIINDDGQTFVTVGMGGRNHHTFSQKSEWSIIQNNEDFGILNLNLVLNGTKIRGEFITNDGRILDTFELCLSICPDFSGEDLREVNFSGEDLSWMNLSGANLSGKDLSGTNLVGANLADADLSGVNLSGLDLSFVNLSGVDLSGKDLSGTNLTRANLANADLTGVDLSGLDLSLVTLSGVDLSGKDLTDTYLFGVNLANANLDGVVLSGKDLRFANLMGVNLSGKDLSGTNLLAANLADADLSGVNLSGLDLGWVNLSGVDLSGKDLNGTLLTSTIFIDSNLSGVDFRGKNFAEIRVVGANLINTNLAGVDLSGKDLTRVNLSGADLSGKNLTRTDFYQANLTGANLDGAILRYTILDGVDLKNANLSNVKLGKTKLDCFNHPICN